MKEIYLKLFKAAEEVMELSYSPYSNFKIGAAILDSNGNIHVGTNVENSSYGATICGERSAIASMVSNGDKTPKAIAISGKDEKGNRIKALPCGICRQVMSEFNECMDVIIGTELNDLEVIKLQELLPRAFSL